MVKFAVTKTFLITNQIVNGNKFSKLIKVQQTNFEFSQIKFVFIFEFFSFRDFQNTAITVKYVPFSVNLLLVPLIVFWLASFSSFRVPAVIALSDGFHP